MTNSSRSLATWIVAVASPLVASVLFYVASDPFCVLHRKLYAAEHPVAINRDYASTQLYLEQQGQHDYDSIVFGNSRSTAFRCSEWLAAMGRPGQRCFHFDAWKESLFGLAAKVRLVDELGHSLRDVLVVVDGSLLAGVLPGTDPAFRNHPRLVGQGWFGFEADYLTDFFSNHFCLKYVDYALFGKVRGYMGAAFDARAFTHLPDSNDVLFSAAEVRIAREGEAYWRARPNVFVARKGGVSPITVLGEQRRLLEEIRSVLERHGTRARIVVAPLYDEIRMNPSDLQTLRAIFGSDSVADYSGDNPLTEQVQNYYEASHFRPEVARKILSDVYGRSAARDLSAHATDSTPGRGGRL